MKIYVSISYGQLPLYALTSPFQAPSSRAHLFGLGGDEVSWRGHGLGGGVPPVPPSCVSARRLQVDLGVHFRHGSRPRAARRSRVRVCVAARVAAKTCTRSSFYPNRGSGLLETPKGAIHRVRTRRSSLFERKRTRFRTRSSPGRRNTWLRETTHRTQPHGPTGTWWDSWTTSTTRQLVLQRVCALRAEQRTAGLGQKRRLRSVVLEVTVDLLHARVDVAAIRLGCLGQTSAFQTLVRVGVLRHLSQTASLLFLRQLS